jgi:hypothetical protein
MNTKDGVLENVIAVAVPLCQQAQKHQVRRGAGRPPVIPDWFISVMIMVAIAKGKTSKAAQLRFWSRHQHLLDCYRDDWGFPSKSTYYERYLRCWKIFEKAIEIHTRKAIGYRWIDAEVASVDKSVIPARGKRPRKSRVKKQQRRVDDEAGWTWSDYHGWVYGYSFEVVLTSKKATVNWPLMASADTASRSETKTLAEKIPRLPGEVKYLLADRGYDADDHCEQLEWDGDQRTSRRFVCPTRRSSRPIAKKEHKKSKSRIRRQAHRALRKAFVKSPKGKKLYQQRARTIEPFNSWFKLLFNLNDRVWHRGLENNQTQILAAIFLYQVLLRINFAFGYKNGQIKWLLDGL